MRKQPAQQVVDYLETTIEHRAECGNCSKEFVSNESTPLKAAREAISEGWREVDSEEFGAILLYCPECVDLKCYGSTTKIMKR